MGKEKIKIDDLKATMKQSLKDDDLIHLKLKYNQAFKEMFKEVTTQGVIPFDYNLNEDYQNGETGETFERYAIKKPIYASLINYSQSDFIFLKDLIEKGSCILKFESLNKLNKFKTNFKEALKKVVESWGSMELTQHILFNTEDD